MQVYSERSFTDDLHNWKRQWVKENVFQSYDHNAESYRFKGMCKAITSNLNDGSRGLASRLQKLKVASGMALKGFGRVRSYVG